MELPASATTTASATGRFIDRQDERSWRAILVIAAGTDALKLGRARDDRR